MASKKVKFRIQGHEKFALRDGWLSKGLVVVSQKPDVFQGKEGPDTFGIGNNMVKSLRYWLKAFGLIIEKPGIGASLTELGNLILNNDLYLEDTYTLWVLHSNLVKNKEEATTWYVYFNKCDAEDLGKDQIEQILIREISKYVEGQKFSEKSVKADVDVLLNMYSRTKGISDPEDKNTSPFAELRLVKNTEGKYAKNHPDRRTINEWNVLYELSVMMEDCSSLSIDKVISDENGLSKIYNITPILANEILDRLDSMGFIQVDRTAGLDMIYKIKDFTPVTVMNYYYDRSR